MDTDRHRLGAQPETRNLRCCWVAAVMVCGLLGLAGYRQKTEAPQQRYQAARGLYEQTTKNLHLPSASATGAGQQRLQTETAAELDALLPAILDRAFKGEL